MKIIDSNGRLFGKINMLDLLIIVSVIVLLFSVKVKFDKSPSQMSSDKKIIYTVEVKDVRQPTVDAIYLEQKNIIDNDTKKDIGKIVNITQEKTKENVKLVDGTYKVAEKEDKFDIVLTLETNGTETKDNYFTSTGKKLIVGDSISIHNKKVLVSGKIKSIEVISE